MYHFTVTSTEVLAILKLEYAFLVADSPRMAQLTNSSTLEATAGGSVILPCPVNSFPSPTRVQWSRVMDGQRRGLNTSSSPRYSGGSATDQVTPVALHHHHVARTLNKTALPRIWPKRPWTNVPANLHSVQLRAEF